MFDVVAISELQKSLSRILKSTKGFLLILSNNKIQGGIVGKEFLQYLDDTGILEDYEDMRLLELNQKESAEAREKLRKGNFSGTLTFDELCQSN